MTASNPAQPAPANEEDSADADVNPETDLEKRLAHAEDQWRRSAADLENLQKRFHRELGRGRLDERERTLLLWIHSIDDLERSLNHSSPGQGPFVDGIQSIVDRAVSVLASMSYERFGAAGDTFDPKVHEVVSTVPATKAAPVNQIVAVVKPGYGTADALLRAASVVVAAEAT